MRFASAFRGITSRYGQPITLIQNGEELGTAQALIRPLHDQARQVVPTELGQHQRDTALCLADPAFPLQTGQTGLVLIQGTDRWTVSSVRPAEAGTERIYWRLILVRREEERL